MPRKKKDGRYINYYIDREIFQRLERYAEDKGQQMTTAIERILKEHLDKYEAEKASAAPVKEEYQLLIEKELIWSEALGDILTQNGVPYITKTVLGAGLTSKLGSATEKVRFYVPAHNYDLAQELERQFFDTEYIEDEDTAES